MIGGDRGSPVTALTTATAMGKIADIQGILGVKQDSLWGPKSQAALDALTSRYYGTHLVKATSFADPADVKAFKACKAQGKTDTQCFRVGDNGRGTPALGRGPDGKGTDTTAAIPMCALPPEDWEPLGADAPGARVLVRHGDVEVVCELRDTMPHKAAITNGAGIDLNPAACKALGIPIPASAQVVWSWAEKK